jgi:HK97 gp10 family phage protein
MIGNVVLEYDGFDELAAALPRAVGRIVWRSANRIRSFAMTLMRGAKHGRLYRRSAIRKSYKLGGRGFRAWQGAGAKAAIDGDRATFVTGYKFHRASAPGEAPAIDTGNLRGSISADMTGDTTAMVSVNAEHGIYLEYGTRKMAKRPCIRPAVEAERPRFTADMRNLESEWRRG